MFRKSLLVSCLICLFIDSRESIVIAQSAVMDPATGTREVVRVLRTDGWVIPRGKWRPNSTEQVEIEGVKVAVRTRDLASAPVQFVRYFVKPEGYLRIRPEQLKVLFVSEYAVKGQVFAYLIQYSPYSVNGESASTVFMFSYYDLNGDGVFEERVNALRVAYLPDWVKKL